MKKKLKLVQIFLSAQKKRCNSSIKAKFHQLTHAQRSIKYRPLYYLMLNVARHQHARYFRSIPVQAYPAENLVQSLVIELHPLARKFALPVGDYFMAHFRC